MLIHWIRYIRGYVLIKLTGYAPERFLNLCSNHNILVWDIEKQGSGYRMKMSIRGFRRIRPLARKTKTKIMILEKHGLPFFIFQNRKRKAFFIGMLLCAGLLYTMSLFIWDIRIEGCVQYTPDLLMDGLEVNGIRHGMKKSDVDGEAIQFLLRNEYDRITWASVSIEGTRLRIQIKENTITAGDDEKQEEETYSSGGFDLIAPAEGIIRHMIVRKGTPVKQVGDSVLKKEALVSGRIAIMNDYKEVQRYEYCTADADILIEYEIPCSIEVERAYKKRVYTGAKKKGFFLEIAGHGLSFAQNTEKFEIMDTSSVQHQLRLLDNFYLPVYWGYTTYREYELEPAVYTEEETEMLLKGSLKEEIRELEKKGIQIIENNVKIQIDKGRGMASGRLLVQEKAQSLVPTEVLPDPVPPEEIEDN